MEVVQRYAIDYQTLNKFNFLPPSIEPLQQVILLSKLK